MSTEAELGQYILQTQFSKKILKRQWGEFKPPNLPSGYASDPNSTMQALREGTSWPMNHTTKTTDKLTTRVIVPQQNNTVLLKTLTPTLQWSNLRERSFCTDKCSRQQKVTHYVRVSWCFAQAWKHFVKLCVSLYLSAKTSLRPRSGCLLRKCCMYTCMHTHMCTVIYLLSAVSTTTVQSCVLVPHTLLTALLF